MFWNRNKNTVCDYWECYKETSKDNNLCSEHYKMWEEGLLDKCPRCGRLKDTVYFLCLDCYVGRKIKKKKPEPPPKMPSQAERLDEYIGRVAGITKDSKRRFIYILEVGDGTLYVGLSHNIRDRLKEIRKPKKSTRTAQPPKLRYLEAVRSERRAKERVLELREFAAINPGYIDKLGQDFFNNMKEIGFDFGV